MKHCVKCHTDFSTPEWECPSCKFTPNQEDGFLVFAPDLANDNDGFNKSSYEQLSAVEDGHFWFEGRNKIVVGFAKKYFPLGGNYLELGCGTGFVLRGIARSSLPFACAGSELYLEGLRHANARLNGQLHLHQIDGRQIPFTNEFDIIGAYDCLEHIDDDKKVLQEMYRALKSGGGIILTVPQHPSLWSQIDDLSCHKRRYTKKDLIQKITDAGFKIERTTSFVSFLFPVMWGVRMYRRIFPQKQLGKLGDGMKINGFINFIFATLMKLEHGLIKLGINFPFGGSRLVVARKL